MRTFRIILMAAIAAFSFELLHADSKDCARDYIKIIVARHAQRPSGGDPSLSKLGREQAQMLAERIKSIGFDGKIYVSPYLRTVETGVAIARLFGQKVLLEPSIQERTHPWRTGYKRQDSIRA
ncbi:MAG: histidine phosphatase family protein [Bacilli bacterium]